MTSQGAAPAFTVLIPARKASSRLPGKVLADLGGKPMVVRVADQAAQSGARQVVVATDDADILKAVEGHGHRALMTGAHHPTGTDRLAEAAKLLGLGDQELVVNVQGDEPLISPLLIAEMAAQLARRPDCAIATACHPLADAAEMFNPNIVKVVLDRQGTALYFSRAAIPWARDAFAAGRETIPAGLPMYRHIGLYAYRMAFLAQYPKLEPAPIEQFEALEQLRALWHGYRIAVQVISAAPSPDVNTPADLERVRRLYGKGA